MKFKKGDKWIDEEQCEKIEMYKNNLKLYKGKHYEVFEKSAIARMKKSGYDINSKGTFLMYNYQNVHMPVSTEVSLKEIFVSENVLGLATKVFRNFLFGEDPVITNEDEIQTAWINDLCVDNDMHTIYQKGLVYQSVCGFAAIKTSLVIDEKQGNKIKFALYENEYIKVNEKDNEKEEIDNIQIIYTTKENTVYSMNEQDTQEILHVETHYKDRIEYDNYIVEHNSVVDIFPLHKEQKDVEFHNVGDFLVTLIHNELADELEGESDYTETSISLQKELDVRLTQTSMSLDKTQNPTMQLPESMMRSDPITGAKYFDFIGKGIPANGQEAEPKYIEYSGNYNEVEEINKNRRNALYAELNIVPAIFDTEKLGNASGTQLKIKLMPTLAAVLNKKNQWIRGIKTIFNNAFILQFNKDKSLLKPLSLKFYDGIPVDRMEEAEISKIRVGNTQSIVSSIMEQDGKTEEAAMKEYDRIKQEEKEEMQNTLPDYNTGAGGV